MKQKSIPKLQVEAAVLGVRLLQTVRKAFTCTFTAVKFWTDSCVILDWIQRQIKLKSLVANRVNKITQHSDLLEWNYVPTKQNPLQITAPVVSNPKKSPPNELKVHPP